MNELDRLVRVNVTVYIHFLVAIKRNGPETAEKARVGP